MKGGLWTRFQAEAERLMGYNFAWGLGGPAWTQCKSLDEGSRIGGGGDRKRFMGALRLSCNEITSPQVGGIVTIGYLGACDDIPQLGGHKQGSLCRGRKCKLALG